MLSRKWKRSGWTIFALVISVVISWLSIASGAAQQPVETKPGEQTANAARWETPARKHRTLSSAKVRGTLTIDDKGVEFQVKEGRDDRWTFAEIHTAFIAPHRLVLETYMNRSLHRPGEQRYEFDLTEAVPAPVAAALAAGIARPLQNAVPDPAEPATASIPVRHRTLTGGTNGILRFRHEGIDYVTASRDDSRSWRWADLQTISDPDPYHLFLFGYRATYTFDLKAPVSRDLLNRAMDEIYAHNGSLAAYSPGASSQPDPQGAETRVK